MSVNPEANAYWKPRYPCWVPGCVRERCHKGFHTTIVAVAHKEDRSGESATPDSLLRQEAEWKLKRKRERIEEERFREENPW